MISAASGIFFLILAFRYKDDREPFLLAGMVLILFGMTFEVFLYLLIRGVP